MDFFIFLFVETFLLVKEGGREGGFVQNSPYNTNRFTSASGNILSGSVCCIIIVMTENTILLNNLGFCTLFGGSFREGSRLENLYHSLRIIRLFIYPSLVYHLVI